MTKKSDRIKDWIFDYITENGPVSCNDQKFHEEFHDKWGGKYNATFYGAQRVYKAMRYLKTMYDERTLRRTIHQAGADNIDGFPNWEYFYNLRGR